MAKKKKTTEEEEVYPLVYNQYITIYQKKGSKVVIKQTGKPVNPPPTSP
jgi:hypothetical protein